MSSEGRQSRHGATGEAERHSNPVTELGEAAAVRSGHLQQDVRQEADGDEQQLQQPQRQRRGHHLVHPEHGAGVQQGTVGRTEQGGGVGRSVARLARRGTGKTANSDREKDMS